MTKKTKVRISYFSDVLCVWAYVSQIRLDELNRQFGDKVEISHREKWCGLRLRILTCDDVAWAYLYCDRTLQHLLRTFLDITLLKAGPEELPRSIFVLVYAIGLLIFAFALSAVLTPGSASGGLAVSFLVAVLSYIVYWVILILAGFGHRMVPTIAAIMACGSILTVVQSVVFAVMNLFATAGMTATSAWLILIWAIPVKGNIIARAIGQHWFIGIAIAMSIFVMQNIVYVSLVSR